MSLVIGLCYDLKADYLQAGFSTLEVMEFEEEETIISLETTLIDLGHQPERIGTGKELARRLVKGDRWDLIFNLAEGVKGRSREAQVPALCELFDQPYTFSDPLTCALTLDKALTKRVLRDFGLPTPAFVVLHSRAEAQALSMPFPLFVKPVAEGSSKGITDRSLVTNPEELISTYQLLSDELHQPILVETFLPGREVTVGVIGNGKAARVIGVMEIIFKETADISAYTALNKKEYLHRISYSLLTDADPLLAQANQLALEVYQALNCRDTARMDLRCDAQGKLHFLEINPLPGMNSILSDLPIIARLAGWEYKQLVAEIIESAQSKVKS